MQLRNLGYKGDAGQGTANLVRVLAAGAVPTNTLPVQPIVGAIFSLTLRSK